MLADLHNAEELKAAAVKFIVDRSAEFVDQVELLHRDDIETT